MNLTKEYLRSIGTMKGKKRLDEKDVNQILKNQEDAEKYQENFAGLDGSDIAKWQQIQIKYIKLQERLKKRIEELKKEKHTYISFSHEEYANLECIDELQKLLDGKE